MSKIVFRHPRTCMYIIPWSNTWIFISLVCNLEGFANFSSPGRHGNAAGGLTFLADVNSRSRSLLAIAIPSVCCLSVVCRLSSVTLVHPTQAVELFGNFFHHTIAQGLYFSGAKNHWWGRPFPPEICVQSDPPPFKQRNFDQYRHIVPKP